MHYECFLLRIHQENRDVFKLEVLLDQLHRPMEKTVQIKDSSDLPTDLVQDG